MEGEGRNSNLAGALECGFPPPRQGSWMSTLNTWQPQFTSVRWRRGLGPKSLGMVGSLLLGQSGVFGRRAARAGFWKPPKTEATYRKEGFQGIWVELEQLWLQGKCHSLSLIKVFTLQTFIQDPVCFGHSVREMVWMTEWHVPYPPGAYSQRGKEIW